MKKEFGGQPRIRSTSLEFPKGFSLIELLVAMTITVGLAAVSFQLFQQNARVFSDQDLIIDAQQMARAAVSEIADEIRMAGQGVPVYSASYDPAPDDGSAVIMPGSGVSRINLRSGRSNIESTVTTAPVNLTRGSLATLAVADGAVFANAIGSTPNGKFVFIWGTSANRWGWTRASVSAVSTRGNAIQLTPAEINGSASSLQFPAPSMIVLEEAVTIYYDSASKTLRRTTATDMTNPGAPLWAPANDLAINVTGFALRYYDRAGTAILPDTAVHRAAIAGVEFETTIEVERALSTGIKPAFTLAARAVPRNLRIP